MPRDILTETLPFLDEENIILLVGARQTGKTSLLYLLIKHLHRKNISPSQIVYFDLENIHDFSLLQNLTDFNDFLQILKDRQVDLKKRAFVFIDEIQHLNNPSSFLKYLHDHYKPKLKFIVTGSSSLEIKKKFTDRLTGRIYRFVIKPLSFKEFLEFKGEGVLAKKVAKLGINFWLKHSSPEVKIADFSNSEKEKLADFLNEYLVFGGYPAISLRESPLVKQKELQEIYSLYVRRDIKDIGEIEDAGGYNRLVSLLGFQIGNLVKETELSISSELARPTVKRYLFLLENTFVLKLIPPFFTNKRIEITKTPKVYFEDIGLRNGVVNNFEPFAKRADSGAILENFVYSQLAKADGFSERIRFWRNQAKNEVDFVWLKDLRQPYPIEVKIKYSQKQTLPSGLKSFVKLYQPNKVFVIHLGDSAVFDFQKTRVYLIPAWAI